MQHTAVDTQLAVHALGPLRVTREGVELRLGGARQRRLLAVLLIHRGAVVSVDRVAEAVFAGAPTEAAAVTLRSYVARLRRVLGEGAVVTRPPGYQLVLPAGAVDVTAFEEGVAAAHAALDRQDARQAVERVRHALDLWQGEAFAEFAEEHWALPEAQRLAELRLTARELLAEASLAAGRAEEVLASLEALRREHPLREGVRGLLMTAYYRAGRQADALAEMRSFRAELVEDLGIDPAPSLVELEARILAQDPGLLGAADSAPLRGYLLGQRLGTGREGTVHAATLPGVERELVVKTLHAGLADDPDFIRAFDTTAHRVAALRHPAVLRIHDYWREPGSAYVVLPRLSGGSLHDRLRRGPLTRDELRALVERIGGALLATAAAGLVHGRVTPENILYDGPDPVLTDFWLGGPPPQLDDAAAFAALVREAGGPVVEAEDPGDLVVGLLEELGEPPPPEARPNPYQGLRAFDEADEAFYFGRRGLLDDVLGRLAGGDRLVLLVGASGTGKSSAVRAGLLPRLRAGGVPGSDRWFVATMLPGGTPYAELAETLTSIAVVPTDRLDERMRRSDDGIHAALLETVPEGGELLLLVDQFEELFTMARDQEQRQFLAALTHALTVPGSRLRVLATLRADYYDRPLAVQPFGSLVQDATVTIPAMLPAEIEAAIVEPARRVGRTVESGLAAELVGTVATEPAALPALQFVLYELAERGTLTLAAYRQLGGLAGAIAARAEELYESLDDGARRNVRELFEQLVVVTDGEPTRRRASRDEVGAADAVVDRWARARLLTLDVHPQTRVPTVEVAHEALVREWPRLQGWIEADRSDLVVLARVREAAHAWDELDRDPAALLRGSALEAALEVVESRDVLPVLEAEFVDASRREDERQRVRQVVEIRRQVRTNRRLRAQLAGIAVMLALALVGGFFALDQSREAVSQRHQAVARELAAAAAANLRDDPERSILLALAAVDATRSRNQPVLPEALESLHRGIVSNRIVRTFPGVGGAVAWSPDGRWFSTEGQEETGLVQVHDIETGKVVMEVKADRVDINRTAFSPDSRRIASVGDDGGVRVWEVATGRPVAAFAGEGVVRDVEFSPDGNLVAAVRSTEQRASVYDLRTGKEVASYPSEDPSGVEFSPDGRLLVVSAYSNGAEVRDVRSGRKVRTLLPESSVAQVSWSPDGRLVAAAAGSREVPVLDAGTGLVVREAVGHTDNVANVEWSPDSTRLATASEDGTVRVFDATRVSLPEEIRLAASDMSGGVLGLAFSASGAQLLTGDFEINAARIWDLRKEAGREVASVAGAVWHEDTAAFAAGGKRLWIAQESNEESGRVELLDIEGGARYDEVLSKPYPGVVPSPDGELLAVLEWEEVVVRRTSELGKVAFRIPTPQGVNDFGWSPDSRHLALLTSPEVADPGVLVYDRTGRLRGHVRGPEGVQVPAFAWAGDLLATTGQGERFEPGTRGIWLWNWESGELVRRIRTNALSLAANDRGDLVATAGIMSGVVTVWDTRTGKQVSAFEEHTGPIEALAFDHRGTRVASSSGDGTVRVWAARTGRLQVVLRAPASVAIGAKFSPDGRRLLTLWDDGVARVMTLDPDELVRIARKRVTRGLTESECVRFLHLRTCPGS